MISTDIMRLQQVLLNYQSNAIKFTPDGRSIQIDCILTKTNIESDPGVIEIQVKDTGIGISQEDQEKLFKMFGYI
jgi:two-component system sensor histidine kinase/response regulator